MKPSSYLRAQNFAAPSINDNEQNEISTKHKKSSHRQSSSSSSSRTNNIMFDSRVCRGNTYAAPVLTEDQRRYKSVYERMQRVRRLSIEKRNMEVSEKGMLVNEIVFFGKMIAFY